MGVSWISTLHSYTQHRGSAQRQSLSVYVHVVVARAVMILLLRFQTSTLAYLGRVAGEKAQHLH